MGLTRLEAGSRSSSTQSPPEPHRLPLPMNSSGIVGFGCVQRTSTIEPMETCTIANCNRDGYATAWTDFVTPDGEVFLLGPTALCGEHASLLERFMVEVQYPDGRIVKSREPGQPLSSG